MLRFASLASTTIACALVMAACGSSSPSSSGDPASVHQSAFELSKCMRANGLPNFPDPGSGGGLAIQASRSASGQSSMTVNGVSVDAPAFQAAMQKCQQYLPHGGAIPASQLSKMRAGALAMAKCMRAHGVPNFPDPRVGTGPSGFGVGVKIGPGSGLDPQSPAFQSAQKICGLMKAQVAAAPAS